MIKLAAILTDSVIAAAIERAEHAVCPPGDARCYGLPYGAADALATLTAHGRQHGAPPAWRRP